MSATPRRLALCLVLVVLAFTAAPAGAVPFDTGVLLGKLREILSFVWAANGCEIEPNGRCGTLSAPNGCEVDPLGRCKDVALVPHGSTESLLSTTGCEIDPWGHCGN